MKFNKDIIHSRVSKGIQPINRLINLRNPLLLDLTLKEWQLQLTEYRKFHEELIVYLTKAIELQVKEPKKCFLKRNIEITRGYLRVCYNRILLTIANIKTLEQKAIVGQIRKNAPTLRTKRNCRRFSLRIRERTYKTHFFTSLQLREEKESKRLIKLENKVEVEVFKYGVKFFNQRDSAVFKNVNCSRSFCSVCQEKKIMKTKLLKTDCNGYNHLICFDCLSEWINICIDNKTDTSCPCCRKIMLKYYK